MYGPTPEEMKPGETYRVVEDKEHGGIRLGKVERDIVIRLTEPLLKVMKVEAALVDMTVEEVIVDDLNELIKSRLDNEWFYQDWVKEIFRGKEESVKA